MEKRPKAGRRQSRPERLDIRDVARHAKVSSATVSRTINGVATVNPALAKRVWQAIEELNYFPNTQARALVSGRSRILGLIVSEITNPFFPELIQQFEDLAVESGYEILIGSTNYDQQRTARVVRRMIERKVDGIAVMTFGIATPVIAELAAREMPLVFMDDAPEHSNACVLTVDYQAGLRQAVQHLAALGHRRIAFISGPLTQRSAADRRDAFVKAMTEIGAKVSPDDIVEGSHTLEAGMESMSTLLKKKNRPTAVVCSNDMTAIGVLHELYGRNMRVPDDISVIGFDDIHIAGFTLPPLTTIRMACSDIARSAIEALRSRIEPQEGKLPAPEWVIPTQLIVRQTTNFPPGSLQTAPAPGAPLKPTKSRTR